MDTGFATGHGGQGAVALLVDFENLIYGLEQRASAQRGAARADFDPDPLFRLSQEYGQVVLAQAYADWRSKEVNQYQTELYRSGMELIHVFGKWQGTGFKNAVDVKMAVDAIELVWTLPHVRTFVVVSGDRDFIHLLKALRRHGKFVVGVSPAASTSEDFADLCDRFVRYESLSAAYEVVPQEAAPALVAEYGLVDVKRALRELLAASPLGVKGAVVKPALRKRLASTFDESDLGFRRLSDLLLAMPDVVRIERNPTPGGDNTLFLASPPVPITDGPEETASPAALVERAAKLNKCRFERDRERRRRLIGRIHDVLRAGGTVVRANLVATLQDDEALTDRTATTLARTLSLLIQGKAIEVVPGQSEIPGSERLVRIAPNVTDRDRFVTEYETAVVCRLLVAAKSEGVALGPGDALTILGCEEEERGRVADMMREAEARLVNKAASVAETEA